MLIALARHGRPVLPSARPISGRDLGEWVRRYNDAGVVRSLAPPASLCRLAASSACVLASDLRRSIESAAWLVPRGDVRIEADLREAGLPETIELPIRMSPRAWVAIARALWWLNLGTASETIGVARRRAARMTDRLCALADEHDPVLVIGHGVFNGFVAGELLKRGWQGPQFLPAGYWATATYRLDRRSVDRVV
jgi:broad specificity phosphatase PhoE